MEGKWKRGKRTEKKGDEKEKGKSNGKSKERDGKENQKRKKYVCSLL